MSNYVLIPAYNEEKNIADVIRETKKLRIKPIVIDDGSTDKTYEISKKNGAITLRSVSNKGKGEALNLGFNYISKKHPDMKNLVIIDADMQYNPSETIKMIKELDKNEADVIMGYRDWGQVPFLHKLGNFVWRTTFNIFFGTSLKDTNCGLMVFNKKSVSKLKNRILGGYIVDNSILIGALKNNLRIKQVPVKVHYHRKSGVGRGIKIVGGVLLYIIKEGLKYRLGRKN